jgi:transposase
MSDAVGVGNEADAGSAGFGGRLEVLDGPSGRRRWPDALKGRMVAESFAPGARVCDVARRYRVSGQQLTTWRRAAREGLLALPGDAVGSEDLGLVSVEVESLVSVEAALPERGDRDSAWPGAGPDDRIEIVAEGVMVRLPATTPVARVVEIAVALGARA